MQVTEAVDLINNRMAFWEGWQFRASHYYGTTLYVEVRIATVDTSYPDSDGVCRSRKINLRDGFTVDVARLDELGLLHRVLEYTAETHEHEDREALKVRQGDGSWVAPLHPHTDSGESAWRRFASSALLRKLGVAS